MTQRSSRLKKTKPRQAPKSSISRSRPRKAPSGSSALSVLHQMCATSPLPVSFPDGTEFPCIPYQTRWQQPLKSNGAGNFAFTVFPDDPLQAIWLGDFGPGLNFPLAGWTGPFPNASFDTTSVAQVRLISARLTGAFIGDTLNDGGLLVLKSNAPDWTELTDGGPNFGMPNDPALPAMVDARFPLREGFEYVFLPEDPRSRTFAPCPRPPFVGTDSATVRALAAREYDKWPYLTIFLEGGKVNTSVMTLELICNWEIFPTGGSILSRTAPPPPPQDSPLLDRFADVASAIITKTTPIASRAQTNPAGGLGNFLMESILGPAGRALISAGGRAAQSALSGPGPMGAIRSGLSGHLPAPTTSPFIEELAEDVGEGVLMVI